MVVSNLWNLQGSSNLNQRYERWFTTTSSPRCGKNESVHQSQLPEQWTSSTESMQNVHKRYLSFWYLQHNWNEALLLEQPNSGQKYIYIATLPKTNTNGMERVAASSTTITIPRVQPNTSNSTCQMEVRDIPTVPVVLSPGEEVVFYHAPSRMIRHGILPWQSRTQMFHGLGEKVKCLPPQDKFCISGMPWWQSDINQKWRVQDPNKHPKQLMARLHHHDDAGKWPELTNTLHWLWPSYFRSNPNW